MKLCGESASRLNISRARAVPSCVASVEHARARVKTAQYEFATQSARQIGEDASKIDIFISARTHAHGPPEQSGVRPAQCRGRHFYDMGDVIETAGDRLSVVCQTARKREREELPRRKLTLVYYS